MTPPAGLTYADGFTAGFALGFVLTLLVVLFVLKILGIRAP